MAEDRKPTQKVKITSTREYSHYVTPGQLVTMVEITYRTAAGYEGTITLTKAEATTERIAAEIKKALTPVTKLPGTEIEV